MKEFIHTVKFKIIIVIAALLLGVMFYAATTGGESSFISSAIGTVVSPIQKASYKISNKVSSGIKMLANSKKHYDENNELHSQLDDLYNQMIDYEKTKEENKNYQELLELSEEYDDLTFSAPASIIGRQTNDIYQSFYIDRGSRDGIALYDPVITDAGLVGFIGDVERTYSKVVTTLSNQFPLGVYCQQTKETALSEGSYELARDGLLQIKFIPLESEMKAGDIITTSGHSGLVPKDELLGIVEEVSIDTGGLSRVATVKPIVNYEELTTVFVVIEFDGQGDGYAE